MKEGCCVDTLTAVFWVVVGILLSLVLPLAVKALRTQGAFTPLAPNAPPSTWWSRLWSRLLDLWKQWGMSRYVTILAAATIVALVIVFLLGLTFGSQREATLAGFAWESLLSKLR